MHGQQNINKKHTDDLTVFMKLFICKRYL